MEHTAEPWTVETNEDGEAFICSPETCCEETTVSKNLKNANARRIVACVNACAGIETETLEHLKVLGEQNAWKESINKADSLVTKTEAQRDKLLAALKELSSMVANVCGFENPCTCRICRAKALIAESEADA